MRIALLAPLVSPIAPPFLGGAQALLYDLAAGLSQRGHAVTLYAADGSHVPGVPCPPLGINSADLRPARFASPEAESTSDAREEEDDLPIADEAIFSAAYAFLRAWRAIGKHAGDHDLVHAHAYDLPAFGYASLQPLPVVHTLHLPAVDPEILRILRLLAPPGESSATRLVTVSRACAQTYLPHCRIDAVIHNGVDVERIPFGAAAAPEGYLLYAGRMTPEKGVEDALEIGARAGRPLLLAGGIYDQAYFDARIAPRLARADGGVRYLGMVGREALWALMAGAAAVLAPAQWEEPFSLVACEAQAAGAPVIAYARGGLREVVADGETGWLVAPGDVAAAAAATAKVGALDRAACRARVRRLFSLARMLDAYEAFYRDMLATRPA
jgi:UDP-glucose:tetrahydrobiopterin glucosyltransferase